LHLIESIFYAALRVPVRAAVGSYFRRVTVRNPEWIPTAGPVLVIANHPATLSEVFILGAWLGRRFHFLAASFVFQPPIRGILARLCGALPIYRRQDNPELTYRNEDVFRACHDLFDRGGAIVIFPEGESMTDRVILPLKTGAARLSLGYESKPGRDGVLAVIPVGLHFSDRTRFQSEVILSVGPRIVLSPFRETGADDPQAAVRQLTATMQQSLEALILNVPDDAIAGFVRDVERLYLEDMKEVRPGEPDLQLLRRMADCIYYYRTFDPQRLYSGWRRTTAYWRKLDALGLRDSVLKEGFPPHTTRAWARMAVGGTAGFAPAVAGLVVNYLPFLVTGLMAKTLAPAASQVSAGRILAGAVFFPLTYGAAAAGLRIGAGWSWAAIAVFLALCFPLGHFALIYVRWLKVERERLRLAVLASGHRRLIAKLRAERKGLIRTFDEARRDYLAAIGDKSTAPSVGP
jgi:glycerol-3-phosphate O-acyltransferase/dihydroxyacetone phosphate acyltransferase